MTDEMELSEREIEIIRLVATGASNKEIARDLVISPNTVKVHLRNIFSKLGVLSRTEATMTAIRMGLVESPGVQNPLLEENYRTLSDDYSDELEINKQGAKNQRRLKSFIIGAISLIVLLIIFITLREITNPTLSEAEINQISSTRWTSIKNLPVGLSDMGSVRYENKFIFFGGEGDTGITNLVWIYDIDNDTWQEGQEIPSAIKDIQATLIGEKIFIPGGLDSDTKVRNELWIYDPRENKWESGTKIPIPISRYSSVSYEGKVYLFGGYDGKEFLNSVYLYNPELSEWNFFGEIPIALADSSAIVLGGKIHVMGGINESGVIKDHYIYYPQRQLSEENAWERAADLPESRFGSDSIVLADMIYLAGGKNAKDELLPAIQYLPPKDSWVEIDTPPIEIGYSPAVLPYETRLYIFGGVNSAGYSAQSLVYQAVYTILVPVVR